MEKKVGTLCLIRRKSDPSLPNAMLIRVMLSEALPDPQHWLMGTGKNMIEAKTSAYH